MVSPEPDAVDKMVEDLRPALRTAPAQSAAAGTAATFAETMVCSHRAVGVLYIARHSVLPDCNPCTLCYDWPA